MPFVVDGTRVVYKGEEKGTLRGSMGVINLMLLARLQLQSSATVACGVAPVGTMVALSNHSA
jgi:hypothetical protein